MRKILLLLIPLLSCNINADKKVTLENFEFKTGDDTELFFKNMRQSYYDLEENKAAKFNLYRLSDRITSDTLPILNLAIVINYLQDEAYLFLEPNARLDKFQPLVLSWKNPADGSIGQWKQESLNREGMFKFASQVYEGILNNYSFQLKDGTPILMGQETREAFRTTVSDYYRLTRLL